MRLPDGFPEEVEGEPVLPLILDFLKAHFAYIETDHDDEELWQQKNDAEEAIPEEVIQWLADCW